MSFLTYMYRLKNIYIYLLLLLHFYCNGMCVMWDPTIYTAIHNMFGMYCILLAVRSCISRWWTIQSEACSCLEWENMCCVLTVDLLSFNWIYKQQDVFYQVKFLLAYMVTSQTTMCIEVWARYEKWKNLIFFINIFTAVTSE